MTFKFFKLEEFACKCGCGTNLQQPTFIQKLDVLRDVYGRPLVVTSGYRCPTHNAKVSSTGATGPHTTGRAVDFAVDRAAAVKLLSHALNMGLFTGFGIQQKGGGRFIHLDDLTAPAHPRPTIWSY